MYTCKHSEFRQTRQRSETDKQPKQSSQSKGNTLEAKCKNPNGVQNRDTYMGKMRKWLLVENGQKMYSPKISEVALY